MRSHNARPSANAGARPSANANHLRRRFPIAAVLAVSAVLAAAAGCVSCRRGGGPVHEALADTGSSAGPAAPSGRIFGEFEDATLLEESRAARPEIRAWSEREMRDGLSGATIQAKTFGRPVPDRTVLCGGKVLARADGFGQYWLALPPGSYELVGRCKGYRDETRAVVVESGSVQYLNFRLERR